MRHKTLSITMDFLSKEEVKNLLDQILSDQKITANSIEVKDGNVKGAGYMSVIVGVEVKGSPRDLHLLVKCMPRKEGFRSELMEKVCRREILFYKTLLPGLLSFQGSKLKEPGFTGVPRCYKLDDELGRELFVLDNLTKLGYRTWNRNQLMDDEHIRTVLRGYGKFHALSHALRDQRPQDFADLTKDLDDSFALSKIHEIGVAVIKSTGGTIKELFDPEKDGVSYKMAAKMADDVLDYMSALEGKPSRYPVVAHGDCWCSNMLFKYEGTSNKNPTDVCFVDFQACSLTTGMHDIAYFLYASSPIELLDNIEPYLRVYHDTLAELLRALGSDPDRVYPFDAMMDEWLAYRRMGFHLGSMIIVAMYRDEEEVVDSNDAATDADMVASFGGVVKDDRVNRRRRELVEHLCRKGIV